jgi:hypothetical protein
VLPIAKPQFCRDRAILKNRLRADLKVYVDAMATLLTNDIPAIWRSAGRGFEKACRNVEHAELSYRFARRNLDEHIVTHGCE